VITGREQVEHSGGHHQEAATSPSSGLRHGLWSITVLDGGESTPCSATSTAVVLHEASLPERTPDHPALLSLWAQLFRNSNFDTADAEEAPAATTTTTTATNAPMSPAAPRFAAVGI